MGKQWLMYHTFMQGEEFAGIKVLLESGTEACLRMRTSFYKVKEISKKGMTLLLTQWLSHPSEYAEFKEIMIEINLFCPNKLICEPANFCVNFGCVPIKTLLFTFNNPCNTLSGVIKFCSSY